MRRGTVVDIGKSTLVPVVQAMVPSHRGRSSADDALRPWVQTSQKIEHLKPVPQPAFRRAVRASYDDAGAADANARDATRRVEGATVPEQFRSLVLRRRSHRFLDGCSREQKPNTLNWSQDETAASLACCVRRDVESSTNRTPSLPQRRNCPGDRMIAQPETACCAPSTGSGFIFHSPGKRVLMLGLVRATSITYSGAFGTFTVGRSISDPDVQRTGDTARRLRCRCREPFRLRRNAPGSTYQ